MFEVRGVVLRRRADAIGAAPPSVPGTRALRWPPVAVGVLTPKNGFTVFSIRGAVVGF